MPDVGSFPGVAEASRQGLYYEALHSRNPLANVFLTGFDEFNPLPFGMSDMFMSDVPDEDLPPSHEFP